MPDQPGEHAAGPRYAVTDSGIPYCQDCGVAVVDQTAHTRFHSILASHGWALAVLTTTHVGAAVHDRYDTRERMARRTFDNWSAEAFEEVARDIP